MQGFRSRDLQDSKARLGSQRRSDPQRADSRSPPPDVSPSWARSGRARHARERGRLATVPETLVDAADRNAPSLLGLGTCSRRTIRTLPRPRHHSRSAARPGVSRHSRFRGRRRQSGCLRRRPLEAGAGAGGWRTSTRSPARRWRSSSAAAASIGRSPPPSGPTAHSSSRAPPTLPASARSSRSRP